MYFLYSLFLTLAFIALLPYFAYQAFVNKKYLNNFRERLGLLPEGWRAGGRPTIWLHAVSVGETLAARPLVAALRARFPEHRLIISTTTATGQAIARSRIAEADGFCYFPFDWRFSVRRALDRVRPQAVILMEAELWPNFLRECGRWQIPVLVANGRMSDRSFARARRFGFLVRRMLGDVAQFAMQTEADAARILALGAPAARVSVSGNLKYDIGENAGAPQMGEVAKSLDDLFALSRAPLIVAGSTSDGEEEILLATFEGVRKMGGLEEARLLLAPRHPERFDTVARLLDSTRLHYVRRSAYAGQTQAAAIGGTEGNLSGFHPSLTGGPWHREAQTADAILLDSIGELAAIYQFASAVFVGGSLVPKGGHNILEPALYSRPVIVGPHMENFREVANEFRRRGAVIQLQGANDRELSAELRDALVMLLTDRESAQRLGALARAAVDENRGATAQTVEMVARLIT